MLTQNDGTLETQAALKEFGIDISLPGLKVAELRVFPLIASFMEREIEFGYPAVPEPQSLYMVSVMLYTPFPVVV